MPVDPNLYTFVKSRLTAGTSKEDITTLLINKGGWNKQDVDQVFSVIESQPTAPTAPEEHSFAPLSAINVSPQVKPDSPLQRPNTPKRGKKGIWLAAIIIVLIVIGAAVASAFYFNVLSLPFFSSRPSPQTVLADAVKAMADVTSFTYAGFGQLNINAVSTSTPIAGTASILVSATSTGSADFSSLLFPVLDNYLQLGIGGTVSTGTTTYSGSVALDFENRLLKQDSANAIYFVLNNASLNITSPTSNPIVSAAETFIDGLVSRIKGQWIYATSTPTAINTTLNQNNIATQKQAILAKLATFDYVSSISELPDTTLNGVSMYHYALVLDLNKLSKEIQTIVSTSTAAIQTPQQPLPPLSLEVWIGKNDSYVYQIYIPTQSINYSANGTPTTMTLESTVGLSDINKPVSVAAPAGAITVQQLLDNFGFNLFSQQSVAKSTKIKKTIKK